MSSDELTEHIGYLRDAVKLDAYERSLTAIALGRSVLDLGAGTGILGLLAARAGARVVYAVDGGPILGPAAETAARSPWADRIWHIRGRSTEIDLPEPVDVAVCDQIGGFVHDAGILRFFADVRKRLLAPAGVLVPARFRLLVAPAECGRVRADLDAWAGRPAGIDFSAFHDLAVDAEYHLDHGDVRLLGTPVVVAEIGADHVEPIVGEGASTIHTGGRCDGLVGWFEADLGGGAVLTNHPGQEGRLDRWVNLYPLASPPLVTEGDRIVSGVDVRPALQAVTWRVDAAGPDGAVRSSERRSTLLGKLLAPDDLARSQGSLVESTAMGRAVARAVALADGSLDTRAIVARLRAEGALDAPGVTEDAIVAALARYTVAAGVSTAPASHASAPA